MFLFILIIINSALAQQLSKPNIVIVIADDLGWNDVGFHSSDVETPNIDALAYNGVMLKRHYSQPMCTPSRAALLTGDYPIRHGMQGVPCIAGVADGLPADLKLMPQYFSDLGYKTHLVGKWHLGFETKQHLPTRRGFDTFFGYLGGYLGYWDGTHETFEHVVGRDFRRGEEGAWKEVYGQYLTEVLTKEAVEIIGKHDSSQGGLLLFLNQIAVHTTLMSIEREAPPELTNTTGRGILNEMAGWMDWSVGEVVAALANNHMLNNTIIVFISDNGAPSKGIKFENHGSNWPFRGQKASVHEGGIRTVGLIYSSQLQNVPRVSEQIFHITDWFPTLYTAAGGDLNDLTAKDGIDQWSSLVSASTGPRVEFLADIDEVSSTEAYVIGNWKLLKNYNQESPNAMCDKYVGESGDWMRYSIEEVKNSAAGRILGVPENWAELKSELRVVGSCADKKKAQEHDCHTKHCLFNLETDPVECQDLSSVNSTIVEELTKRLEFYRKELVPQVPKFYDRRADPTNFQDYWSPWLD